MVGGPQGEVPPLETDRRSRKAKVNEIQSEQPLWHVHGHIELAQSRKIARDEKVRTRCRDVFRLRERRGLRHEWAETGRAAAASRGEPVPAKEPCLPVEQHRHPYPAIEECQ